MGWLPVTFALGLAGLLFWGAAFVAWRRREVPAADLFAVVSGLSGTGALVIAASIGLDFPHEITLLSTIAVGLSLPVPWLLFSLKYTGRGELLSFSATSAAAAPSGIGLVATSIIFGAQLSPWLRLPSQEAASGLVAIGVTLLVTLQWLALLYAGGLMLVGSAVLLATFHRYKHLDSLTGTLLGIFGTVPWLSVLFGLQVDGIAPFALSRTAAVGFLVGGVAAVSVLGPYHLFHRVPAAGNVGPATVIEELDDPVVVTDGGGIVVEVNAAVEQTLGTGATDVVGADIEGLLGAPLTELQGTDTVEIRADAGRTLFEPTVSELTDQHGHVHGHAVVLRDVTVQSIRQQRLEVLNRVLRHNLRNDMTVILANTELIRKQVTDQSLIDSTEAIARAGDDLVRLSQEAREIEHVLATTETTTQRIRLLPLVEDVLADAVATRQATSDYDVPPDLVVEGSADLLELALTNLAENAVEHNDSTKPHVEIRANHDPDQSYPLTISVVDNGPGIPDNEQRIIESGSETSLQHGTGLGLWVVRWAVTNAGGELDFEKRDPRGTIISLQLPRAFRDDTQATAASASVRE